MYQGYSTFIRLIPGQNRIEDYKRAYMVMKRSAKIRKIQKAK